jgi:hypothetical protein
VYGESKRCYWTVTRNNVGSRAIYGLLEGELETVMEMEGCRRAK